MTSEQFVWWLRGFMAGGSTDVSAIRAALANVPQPTPAAPPAAGVHLQRECDEIRRKFAEQDAKPWPSIPPLQPRVLDSPLNPHEVMCVAGRAA